MVDLARLGIEVDARQPQQAADALGRLTAAGQRAETEAQRVSNAYRNASGTLAGLSRATQQSVVHQTAFGRAAQAADAATDRLGSSYAQATLNATAFGRAMSGAAQQVKATSAGFDASASRAKSFGAQANVAGRHVGNMTAQLNDIGVMLASGQSPLILALQQGTQVSQIFQQMGNNGGSAFAALRAGFSAMISPMSLMTLGVIAVGAALAQWAIKAVTAGRETRGITDLIDDLSDKTDAYSDAVDAALMSIDDQVDAYGDLADEMQGVVKLQAQLAQLSAQQALDKTAGSLSNVLDTGFLSNPVVQDFVNLLRGGDSFARLFAIPADEVSRVREMQEQFEAINKSIRESKGNAEAQNTHIRAMIGLATTLAEEWGGISTQEAEYLANLATAADQSARQVIILEEMVVTGTKRLEVSKSDATWIERTLRLLRQQEAEAATIAKHGRDSVEFREQQAQAAREALQADIERREITGETAENLRDALAAQQAARESADKRIEADREALRISQEQEQIAERLARIDTQRQHAEASIAQRLQNRIEVARAIVVYGKDSVQAKLAEEAVSRRLFELDLQRHGITGDIRDSLIAQYEAAAQLEGQIVAAQPAFNNLQTTIDGISNAWAEWIVRGFQDFKSFTQSVLDTFKRMLVQMIATAAKNRIMLSLGIGGGLGGGIASAGGGGGMGGMGSIFGGIGKLFGGGGGGGGLFGGPFGGGFKNAAFNLGLIHGPAIAGGGAAALASGAATSAAFGFGPAAGIGVGGIGAGGGAMAASGLTSLGVAVPIIAGAAILFSGLRSKTKLVDEGIQVAIDATDVLVEGFEKIQKSRWWGLSKKTRTSTTLVDEDVAGPIRDAAAAIRDGVIVAADALNLGGVEIENFSSRVKISLFGLSESEAQAKINASLQGVGNEMAQLALIAGGLDVPLHSASQRLGTLASSLTVVNAALGTLGHGSLGEGVFGGGRIPDAMQRPEPPPEFTMSPTRQVRINPRGGQETTTVANSGYAEALEAHERAMEVFTAKMEGFELYVERQTEEHGGGAIAAEDLLARFGGADQFQAVVGEFFQTFHTEAERMDALRESITGTLGALNTELPDSMAAFRELVEAQSLNTETGRELYATLLQVAPQFATLAEYERQRAEALGEGATALEDAIAKERALAEARSGFEAQASSRLHGLTDTPLEAAERAREEALQEAAVLGAATGDVNAYYDLVTQNIRDEAAAREQAVQEARAARSEAQAAAAAAQAQRGVDARQAFEARTLGMVHGLTDTPLEAAARQRDALLAEAAALGASTDAIIQWYDLQAQSIFDQAAASDAAAEAAAAAAAARAAEARRRELERQHEAFYNTFYSREERVADTRRELTASFERLGLALPDTRQAFRELVEDTRKGGSLYRSLLGLSEQFAFMTEDVDQLNEVLGQSQNLFRDLREEAFVQSAGPRVGTDGVSISTANGELIPLVRELIRAVNSNRIEVVRELEDTRRNTQRDIYRPTRQTT